MAPPTSPGAIRSGVSTLLYTSPCATSSLRTRQLRLKLRLRRRWAGPRLRPLCSILLAFGSNVSRISRGPITTAPTTPARSPSLANSAAGLLRPPLVCCSDISAVPPNTPGRTQLDQSSARPPNRRPVDPMEDLCLGGARTRGSRGGARGESDPGCLGRLSANPSSAAQHHHGDSALILLGAAPRQSRCPFEIRDWYDGRR
jgi:hypothetical protein